MVIYVSPVTHDDISNTMNFLLYSRILRWICRLWIDATGLVKQAQCMYIGWQPHILLRYGSMICVFRLVTLAIVSGLLSFSPFAGTYHQESFWEVKARACGDREGTV